MDMGERGMEGEVFSWRGRTDSCAPGRSGVLGEQGWVCPALQGSVGSAASLLSVLPAWEGRGHRDLRSELKCCLG